jgi:O-antigen/teichoic acid export membrane protein
VKERDKQILINMASGWVPMLAGIVIFIFLTPYMRVKLGEEMLGIWFFITGLNVYFGMVHSSAGLGLTKYVSEYRARGDDESLKTVVSTSIAQYLLFAGVALAAAAAVYGLAGHIPALRAGERYGDARLALGILMLNFCIAVPFNGLRSVINGYLRYDLNNLLLTLNVLLQAGGIFALLYAGYGIVALAVWQVVSGCIINVLILCVFCSICRGIFSRRNVRKEMMKRLFRFGGYSFIISVGGLLFYNTDNIIIGSMFENAALITWYALGFRLLSQIMTLNSSAIQSLLPVASEISTLEGAARRRKIEELFTRGSRFSAIMTLPFFLFLFILGPEFISLWQGPSYQNSMDTYWVFVILAVPHVLLVSQYIISPIFFGLGKLKIITWQWVFMALCNVVLSFLLARRWGIFGVAWGTAIPIAIFGAAIQWYYRKTFEISLRRYFWNVWRRLLPLTGVLALALLGIKNILVFHHLSALLLTGLVPSLAFWVISYRVLDSYERLIVGQLLRKILKFSLRSI